MADRFPLIVNAISKKIEEMASGDRFELTGNGIVISGDAGNGKYLTSNGSTVFWGTPGDVYLTQAQDLSNKTLLSCIISGSLNTLSNIPNGALVNSGISINGTSVALGGSVITPDNNTTYAISAVDGTSAAQKKIRLTSGGNSGSGVTDDVTIAVGPPASIPAGSNALSLSIERVNDALTLSGTVVDNNTETFIQSAVSGSPQTGTITFSGTGGVTVTQNAATKTINIFSTDNNTVTKLRAGTGTTLESGDFTFLQGGATTITQGIDVDSKPTITVSSLNTITRVKGGGSGSFASGDILIEGGNSGNVTVSQSGNTVSINSTDTNTVTKLGSAAGVLAAGDYRFAASGATTVTASTDPGTGVTTFTIDSLNTDTGASFSGSEGILLTGTDFALKNGANLIDNRVPKWDNSNSQLANSLITDDGSTVTISGNFVVNGTNTTINTTTLSVQDNIIELRRGDNLTGSDAGIQVNRSTDGSGVTTSFNRLEWFESGAYWRSYNGSVSNRVVTEGESQTLTNKTLTSPTLTGPTLGVATATTLNGLTIETTANSTLDIADLKTLVFNSSLTFNGTDSAVINFGAGGGAGAVVAYNSNTLATFASTTSTQLRGVVSDSTGTGALTFSASPSFSTSVTTSSNSLDVFNTSALTVNAFGAATALNMGASTGTTTIANSLTVSKNVIFNTLVGETFTVNGTADFALADITIRSASFPIKIGRGGGGISTNTRVGYYALESNSSGTSNTAFGYEALSSNQSGENNTAFGLGALKSNFGGVAAGNNNVAVGSNSQRVASAGEGNVSVGVSSLESNTQGDYNVCIGYFAGYGALGNGNVLIGSASNANSTDATYVPPSANGDKQLVIASGTEAWIRGDANFAVTVPKNLTVGGACTITGNLIVNGTTTTINSSTISIDDKNIELAAVTNITLTGSISGGSNSITTIVPSVGGLIVGMTVQSQTAGVTIPVGTTITAVDIVNNSITLSASISSSTGSLSFLAEGPTDLGADGGGVILKGATNKTILYDHSRTDKYWVFSENLELTSGKKFVIGNQLALSSTALGTTVLSSSLTSVGTLTNLTVDGFVTIGGVVTERVINNFTTTLTPATNVLTINTLTSNTILGKPSANAINTWAFTNVSLSVGQSKTITLILEGNTTATYGDACSVDNTSIPTGVRWSGGSPPLSTTNTDILTFLIVKDAAGNIRVFGQGNTDFS